MNFYKRAYLNIIRQPIKSLILVLVTFLMASGIIISLLIKSAINESTTYMLNNSNSAVTLALNSEVDEKLVNKIGESGYVNYYDYNINTNAYSEELKKYTSDIEKKLPENKSVSDYFDSNYTLTGVNEPELLLLKQNKAQLVAGSLFSKQEIKKASNSAIITESFANKNNLRVGSNLKCTPLVGPAN